MKRQRGDTGNELQQYCVYLILLKHKCMNVENYVNSQTLFGLFLAVEILLLSMFIEHRPNYIHDCQHSKTSNV